MIEVLFILIKNKVNLETDIF